MPIDIKSHETGKTEVRVRTIRLTARGKENCICAYWYKYLGDAEAELYGIPENIIPLPFSNEFAANARDVKAKHKTLSWPQGTFNASMMTPIGWGYYWLKKLFQ